MDKAAGEREGVSAAVPTVEILYFDSLGHRGTAHCNNLIRYLNYEWNRQKQTGLAEEDRTAWPYQISRVARKKSSIRNPAAQQQQQQLLPDALPVRQLPKKCPNQENGHDCGMFVLEYAERFVKDIEFRTRWGTSAVVSDTDADADADAAADSDDERRAAGVEDGGGSSHDTAASNDDCVAQPQPPGQACRAYVQQDDFRSWFHNDAIQDKRQAMKVITDELAKTETPEFKAKFWSIYVRMAGEHKPSQLRRRAVPLASRDQAEFLTGLVMDFVEDVDDFNGMRDDAAELYKVHADKPSAGVRLDISKSPAENLLRNGDILEIRSASWEARRQAAKDKAAEEVRFHIIRNART